MDLNHAVADKETLNNAITGSVSKANSFLASAAITITMIG
jgi:hypothetical protein